MAAAITAGRHDHLIEVIGQITGHPEEKSALALALIADDYRNLALPPCLDSCTRDNYHEETVFGLDELLNIARAIASVAAHLHASGIAHGDLYGHNILINQQAHCLLGDFGAATRYHGLAPELHHAIERIEVRAFGCLLEELLQRICPDDAASHHATIAQLQHLRDTCLIEDPKQRPAFAEIHRKVSTLRN
jgi:Serine/threonine protein kinase